MLSAEKTCEEGTLPIKPIATRAQSDFGMAASGSPEASKAAVEILERGGNAIDAAVAAALMLGVSDPDASGIGNPYNSLLEGFNYDTPQYPGYLQPNVPCASDGAPTIADAEVDVLEASGHVTAKRASFPPTTACAFYFGGVNAVAWDPDAMTFVGVGDQRRWGSAMGPRVVADPNTVH